MATVGIVWTAAGGLVGAVAIAQDDTVAGGRHRRPGEELFLTSCASCHGPQGQGGSRGPDIPRRAPRWRTSSCARAGCRSPIPRAQMRGPRRSTRRTAALVEYVARSATDPRSRRGRERRRPPPRSPAVRRELRGLSRARGRRRRGRRRVRRPGPHASPGRRRRGGRHHGARADARFSFASASSTTSPRTSVPARRPASRRRHLARRGPVTEGFIAALALLVLLLVARWVAVRREGPNDGP